MTKIIMLKTTNGCEDGFTVREYTEGQEYDLPGALASTFIADGVAFESMELGEPSSLPHTDKGKSLDEALENKALQPKLNKKAGKK